MRHYCHYTLQGILVSTLRDLNPSMIYFPRKAGAMWHKSHTAKPYHCHHLVSLCDSHGKSKQVYILFVSHWTVSHLDHIVTSSDLSWKYTLEQVAKSPHRRIKCWGVKAGMLSSTLQCATVTINLLYPNPIIKPTPGFYVVCVSLLNSYEKWEKSVIRYDQCFLKSKLCYLENNTVRGSSRSILLYILCSKNNISSRKPLIVNLANSTHLHICVNNFNMVYYISRKVKS